MNKNPFLNALIAGAYIVIIVLVIDFVGNKSGPEETLLIPITMLSLLVLSVSVMGFLFIYEPMRLILDNQRKEAVTFFAKTVGAFAGIVILLALIQLSGIFG